MAEVAEVRPVDVVVHRVVVGPINRVSYSRGHRVNPRVGIRQFLARLSTYQTALVDEYGGSTPPRVLVDRLEDGSSALVQVVATGSLEATHRSLDGDLSLPACEGHVLDFEVPRIAACRDLAAHCLSHTLSGCRRRRRGGRLRLLGGRR